MDQNQSDHDILIELRSDVKSLRDDVKAMQEAGTKKIDDHETRIRFIERWMWGAIGVIGFSELIIGYYLIIHYGTK